ncbi:hypothetical protein UT300005_10300 [Clostridium sp. CTA-5]
MICKKGGQQLETDKFRCTQEDTAIKLEYIKKRSSTKDVPGFGTFLMATIIPFFGIIMWGIWKEKKPRSADLIFVWSIFIVIIFFIFRSLTHIIKIF